MPLRDSVSRSECAIAFLFAIRPKIKKVKKWKILKFFTKIRDFFCENAGSFPKILPEFPGNSLPYMGIHLTDAEHKIFNYSSTNARIALKVGAKQFLQFILTDYVGIFMIHDAQRVLQTAKIDFLHTINKILPNSPYK